MTPEAYLYSEPMNLLVNGTLVTEFKSQSKYRDYL